MPNRIDELRALLRSYESTVVCFSGGVDSALVLAVAHEQLGSRCVALTTTSDSLLSDERVAAEAFAARLGVRHILVRSNELADPRYAENSVNRCYFCKTELYSIAKRIADEHGARTISNGTNKDDLGDFRPGLVAAREANVRSPLVELGMSKQDVRDTALALGLELWDKPASACLSSRIPYGTAVTPDRLAMIGRAESALRKLGFRQLRVRYHDNLARIEVGVAEIERAFAERAVISRLVREAGFRYVTLDLEGYRVGSHNEVVHLPIVRNSS